MADTGVAAAADDLRLLLGLDTGVFFSRQGPAGFEAPAAGGLRTSTGGELGHPQRDSNPWLTPMCGVRRLRFRGYGRGRPSHLNRRRAWAPPTGFEPVLPP